MTTTELKDTEFPDEFNLRFRAHALYVHIQSTLDFASEIANEGAGNLGEADRKIFDTLADQLERAWIESVKLKSRARN